MKFVVMGGTGAMGKFIVKDLLASVPDAHIVVAARNVKEIDHFVASLKSKRVTGVSVDLLDIEKTTQILTGATVCINCSSYYNHLHVMKACLLAKCHYVDLGGLYHMTKKQLQFHNFFRKKDLLAVIGCGFSPGVTNMMIGSVAETFEKITSAHIYLGGCELAKPLRPYLLPYTAYTLAEEFTDRPMILERGRIKISEPLSGKRPYTFPKPLGKKTCFYVLHSELATLPQSYYKKGLRDCTYSICAPDSFVPEVTSLVEQGMTPNKPMQLAKQTVVPRNIAAKEINRLHFTLTSTPKCAEYALIELEGFRKRKKTKILLSSVAQSNPSLHVSAGILATALPASIVAQLIASKQISQRGVLPPELCVPVEPFFQALKKKGIIFKEKDR